MQKLQLEQVQLILEKMTLAMDHQKSPKTKFETCADWSYYILGLGTLVTALVLSIPFMFGWQSTTYRSYQEVVEVSIKILIIICYLAIFAQMIGMSIWGSWKAFKWLQKPHLPIMKNALKTSRGDGDFFEFLRTQRLIDLRYAALHIQAERSAFGMRAGLIVGAVTKIGLFPALLTYLAVIPKIDFSQNQIIQSFVYAVPVLYLLSIPDGVIREKMSRCLAMLELVIEELAKQVAEENKQRSQSKKQL
jgi:hypothetical protein